MKEELKDLAGGLLGLYLVLCGIGFFIGFMNETIVREENGSGCTYQSLMARGNLGYIAACELLKPRF